MAKNYEVGNIELNIKSSASESVAAFQDIISKVEELTGKLGAITGGFQAIGEASSKMASDVKKPTVEVEKLDKEVEKVGKTAEKTGAKIAKAFTLGGIVLLAKKLADMAIGGIEESAQMIQNYRLLQISSGDYFKEAIDFQSQLTSSFGMNSKDALGVQGYFATLTSSLGIANKEASEMSTTLTKLTYDLGSFFGEDFDSMNTKLQSGLIGQTKPLRSLGIDVTQQTIQGYLDKMGIDALVQDLTQAEKVLLRYISIIDQSRLAHGNLANSIEMPAQQIQVLKAQLKELGMWLYNIFIGTIGKILPYINGFIMALKEMVKAFAILFGFDIKDYGFKDMGNKTNGAMDYADGVKKVGKEADKTGKKMKKMMGLLGFNEINNIKTPEPDSGSKTPDGLDGIGGSGIYDKLLKELEGYDNLMGDVKMKATEIRDKLFDWLGISTKLNEQGEIIGLSWKWGDMATSAKIVSGIIAGIIGFKFYDWILKGVKGLQKFWKFFMNSEAMTFLKLFILKVQEVGLLKATVAGFKAAWGLLAPVLGTVAGAIGLIYFGFKSISFGKLIGEGDESTETMWKLAGSIVGATASGALLGFALGGPVGAAVGALAGYVISLGGAFAAWGMSDVLKDVDNFKGVTEATVEKMKPFEKSFRDVDNVIKELGWSEKIIDNNDVNNIKGRLDDVGTYLKTEIVNKAEETKKKLSEGDYFQSLDPNLKGKLVKQIDDASALAQAETDKMTTDIYNIMKRASDEGRKLSEKDQKDIAAIQTKMYEHGVKTLSASQEDQEKILTNLTYNSTKLSAQQASEIAKNAIDTKNAVVNEANERYAGEMKVINDLWEAGTIDQEQKDAMISAATTFKDSQIKSAEEQHAAIIKKAKEHSGEMVKNIDWETGETLTNFQMMYKNMGEAFDKYKENFKAGWDTIKDVVKNFYMDHIAPWFTKEKWENLFNDALKGLVKGWDAIMTWFNKTIKFPAMTMPSIKFPKVPIPNISMKSGSWNPMDWLAGGGLPKFDLKWETFKDGGFPQGENGFFANDSEMVGKFSNGKTAVANNDQIVKGIQQGVEAGVMNAMANSMNQSSDGVTNIYLDSRLIAKETNKRSLELEMTRG